MKATGIIRRIDDLGRVVIPKEIRTNLHIKEGDPLEIYVDDGKVIFAKHDDSHDKEKFAADWLARNADRLKACGARFTIEGDTTICETISSRGRHLGTARRDSRDSFDPSIGMVIAFHRAVNLTVPDELD